MGLRGLSHDPPSRSKMANGSHIEFRKMKIFAQNSVQWCNTFNVINIQLNKVYPYKKLSVKYCELMNLCDINRSGTVFFYCRAMLCIARLLPACGVRPSLCLSVCLSVRETVEDRRVHAVRGLASTKLSFHSCNVLRDCHKGVPRANKK